MAILNDKEHDKWRHLMTLYFDVKYERHLLTS